VTGLSIIIPAFNEERRLPQTLKDIAGFLDEGFFDETEVIVVDDGSTDRTAALVRNYSEQDGRFRLLLNPGNRGKGYAVRHGMQAAAFEWRLMTDADLSTPIDEVRKLYRAMEEQNASVSIGSRALDRSLVHRPQSMFREFGGRFFNFLMRALTGLPFKDTQCGFKLYTAEAAKEIFARQILTGFSFDVEDVYLAHKLGFRVAEVPVRWANAEGTKVTLRSTVRAFTDLLAIRWFDLAGRYERRAESKRAINGAR
jgi:glycosyltransferase involved in cell wall biosynthesis